MKRLIVIGPLILTAGSLGAAEREQGNKPGVAGFSREKTLEMMEFNRWRNQTAEGRAWDQRQRQQYRYPGDPRENYEDRFIYRGPGIDDR